MTTDRELTPEEELHRLLREEVDYRATNKFYEMYPETGKFARSEYKKQTEFFALGKNFRERCFMGGNGTGKTWGVAAYELTCHLTGEYPFWWVGRVFTTPITAWAGSETREATREIIQAKLIGDVAKLGDGAFGTGMIPRHLFASAPVFVKNTNKSCDYVTVKHKSGGTSVLVFKSYDQGREAYQGNEIHVIVLDEEPPQDIYNECQMRGRTVDGIIIATFTPLKGPTEVVDGFIRWEEANRKGANKVMVQCAWRDVPHLDESWKRQTLAGTPMYLRDARERGEPQTGVGRIYPIEEDQFVIPPIRLQPHWRRCFGFDGGWHNTAAVWLAYDKDEDIAYAYTEYKRGEQTVDVHAAAIMARGPWIPGRGDAASREGHTKDSTLDLYKSRGVKLQLADKSLDKGIALVYNRLVGGKLKVFSTCVKLLGEMRKYAYDENQNVIKRDDHLCDALRFGVISALPVAEMERPPVLVVPQIHFG